MVIFHQDWLSGIDLGDLGDLKTNMAFVEKKIKLKGNTPKNPLDHRIPELAVKGGIHHIMGHSWPSGPN